MHASHTGISSWAGNIVLLWGLGTGSVTGGNAAVSTWAAACAAVAQQLQAARLHSSACALLCACKVWWWWWWSHADARWVCERLLQASQGSRAAPLCVCLCSSVCVPQRAAGRKVVAAVLTAQLRCVFSARVGSVGRAGRDWRAWAGVAGRSALVHP